MRFRFCGDLDCPDWVLAEIANLSKMTSIKMKQFCQQVIMDIIQDTMDYEKINKITADAKYDANDIKAGVATLRFVLTSAARNAVDEDSLSNELQQLGLPKEHTMALCKAYSASFQELQEALKKKTLRLPYLEDFKWRVDYVLCSSQLKEVNEPMVNLQLKVRDPNKPEADAHTFAMTADKFRVMLSELKQVSSIMEKLSQQ